MRHLRPAAGEDEAGRVLRGERSGLLTRIWRGIFLSAPVKSELVWSPVYLVEIALDLRGARSTVLCSVDGLTGAFAIFDMRSLIDEGGAAGDTFRPRLDEIEAERIARESLMTAILRRRGRSGKPSPRETISVELLRWPYWVFYYRRRNGAMDIRVIDAATGDRVGHKIKLGLLDAFCAAAGTEETPEGK